MKQDIHQVSGGCVEESIPTCMQGCECDLSNGNID
jgi:hypothetical protein